MNIPQRLLRLAVALHAFLVFEPNARTAKFSSRVDDDWFRGWPPASLTYSFPSILRDGDRRLGDLDTLEFRATYIEPIHFNQTLDWLLGLDYYRVQASFPSAAPLPSTLQSMAAVIGLDWSFHERWRTRMEILPGIYSDFHDISGDDINAPFNIEVSYSLSPTLLVGGQLNINGRGGWTIDRRYDFHTRDLLIKAGGAPYVQFSLGLTF